MPDAPSRQSEPIPFRASRAKRYAEVVLHYAPAPKPGKGVPYLKVLDSLPKGWTLAAWKHVEPELEAPPKNGEALVAALDTLIRNATSFREEVMTFAEINGESFWWPDLDGDAEQVQRALEALPEPDEDWEP